MEFYEFGWYVWVKFRDTTVSYPEDKLILGRYLGPSTHIGPAIMAKIIKGNGQYQHITTLQWITDEKIRDSGETKARQEFDAEIEKILFPTANTEDFDEEIDV